MESQRVCKLCLTVVDDNEFDTIDEILTHALEMLVLNLRMDEYMEPVVCHACVQSLKKAFDFKMACLNVENKLLKLNNSREDAKLDLKELYLKEPSIETSEIVENQICRFCLGLKSIECCTNLNESKENIFILETLQNHIPELNLSITEELIVCETCLDSLQNFHKFISTSLERLEASRNEELYGTKEPKMEILYSPMTEQENNTNGLYEMNEQHLINSAESEIKQEGAKEIEYFNLTIKNEGNIDNTDQGCSSVDPLEVKPYKCNECSFQTKYRDCLRNHELRHKDPLDIPMYKCDLCTYEARQKRYLKYHMLGHKSNAEITLYKCDQCSYESRHKRGLKYHALNHKSPSEIPIFQCDVCSYKTKYKSGINRHLKTHKKPEYGKIYKCDVCTYETLNKRNLLCHYIAHKDPAEVKWFKCELCPYKTRYRYNLKCHTLKHKNPSDTTMYKCASCCYQTNLRGNLIKHLLIHKQPSEITMYKCEMCSFQTKRRWYVNVHMQIHQKHNTSLVESEAEEVKVVEIT